MTNTQLKTLLAVADTGSVVGASRRLFVSSAAVSSTLAALSREVGTELTVRVGRGLALTPAGTVLAGYASTLLGAMEEALVRSREASQPDAPTLRIGAVATVGEELLPRWLQGYLELVPHATINLEVANKTTLFELLGDHRVDLVISGRPTQSEFVRVIATRGHELALIANERRATEWFDGSLSPTSQQIGEHTWLVREPGSGTRASAEELLGELAISPPTLSVGSNLAMKRLVELGLGVAIISTESVAKELADGELVSLTVEPLPQRRSWCLVVRTGEVLAEGIKHFVNYLGSMGEVEFTPEPHVLGEKVEGPRRLG
ncbi:LysR family transcriptional regulator [Ferrimicrobium sp.]|nr:LysR family transcriptional regulator [Ferrimicrobium sp.]